jgi:hypothetical protein
MKVLLIVISTISFLLAVIALFYRDQFLFFIHGIDKSLIGSTSIDSFEASKIISSLEPKIVIPMHYKTDDSKLEELADISVFLHEMGEKNPQKEDSLKLQAAPTNEDTKIIILNPSH